MRERPPDPMEGITLRISTLLTRYHRRQAWWRILRDVLVSKYLLNDREVYLIESVDQPQPERDDAHYRL